MAEAAAARGPPSCASVRAPPSTWAPSAASRPPLRRRPRPLPTLPPRRRRAAAAPRSSCLQTPPPPRRPRTAEAAGRSSRPSAACTGPASAASRPPTLPWPLPRRPRLRRRRRPPPSPTKLQLRHSAILRTTLRGRSSRSSKVVRNNERNQCFYIYIYTYIQTYKNFITKTEDLKIKMKKKKSSATKRERFISTTT